MKTRSGILALSRVSATTGKDSPRYLALSASARVAASLAAPGLDALADRDGCYADDLVRDGLELTFVSAHRPLQAYTEAIAEADLLIERIREAALPERAITRSRHRRWQRVPLFLHVRALKP